MRDFTSLRGAWLSFKENCIDLSAVDDAQLRSIRATFYAGAASLHNIMIAMLDPGDNDSPTPQEEARVFAVLDEIRDHITAVSEGRDGYNGDPP